MYPRSTIACAKWSQRSFDPAFSCHAGSASSYRRARRGGPPTRRPAAADTARWARRQRPSELRKGRRRGWPSRRSGATAWPRTGCHRRGNGGPATPRSRRRGRDSAASHPLDGAPHQVDAGAETRSTPGRCLRTARKSSSVASGVDESASKNPTLPGPAIAATMPARTASAFPVRRECRSVAPPRVAPRGSRQHSAVSSVLPSSTNSSLSQGAGRGSRRNASGSRRDASS